RAFLKRLEEAQRAGTKLNRFEIVHIPERDRGGLPPGAIMEFTAATAQSLLDSCPERVVAGIAPRPLLLVHPRGDGVVPYQESEALAAAAGSNAELHIIEGSAHFGSGSSEIATLVLDFLTRHLPTISA